MPPFLAYFCYPSHDHVPHLEKIYIEATSICHRFWPTVPLSRDITAVTLPTIKSKRFLVRLRHPRNEQ